MLGWGPGAEGDLCLGGAATAELQNQYPPFNVDSPPAPHSMACAALGAPPPPLLTVFHENRLCASMRTASTP
jgi:hypothetical protein